MKIKSIMVILISSLVVSVVSVGLVAAKPDNPGKGRKPDKLRPVPATDIELVKKITMKGKPPWAGGGAGGGKKEDTAATGILGESAGGDRYAVVVGISEYPGEDNDLEYSDDDALEMADALTVTYGFTDVTTLTDLSATREAIIGAIEVIPMDADEIVFFFSGHGMNGKAKDGDKEGRDEAIVAHDGIEELVPIWDGELREAFSGFDTSRIIFIFDTCLAGGMKSDLEETGRVLAMATTENGYAYESDDLENGEFSYYFVDRGMINGEAHVEEHQYDDVTIEEAFDYAKANCRLDKPTIGDEFEDDLLP